MKSLFKFLTIFLSIIFCSSALAMDIGIEWTPNTEPDLAGYKLFMREASAQYDYTQPVWQGPETTCKVLNLSDSVDYRFVLRAYDVWGNESGDSNEVRLYKGQTPDTIPPAVPKLDTITVTIGP